MQRARSLAGRRAGRLQGQGGAGCVPASGYNGAFGGKTVKPGLINADRGGQAYAYKPELP